MAATKTPLFIVEDEDIWAEPLKMNLSKLPYDVYHFKSGEEAVAQLSKIEPEVVIQDYHLEGGGGNMTGVDTLREVKKRSPRTRVIMYSAQTEVQTALDTLEHGAYHYVMKHGSEMDPIKRLRLLLRNIREEEKLRSQIYDVKFKLKRSRMMVYALSGVFALLMLVLMYMVLS